MKFKAFLLAALFLCSFARAQNAGNTGTFTSAQKVFTSQTTSASSAIVSNIGQSAHFLQYCTTSFGGTIDIEGSFDGASNWTPIARAAYSTGAPDSACHILQGGGYYQYVRSSVTVFAGSVSAWYSSTSGPINFAAPGIGSNGPTSPVVCDNSTLVIVSTGFNGSIGVPISAGDSIVICSFSVSFNGATAAGNVNMFWASSTLCTAGGVTWEMYTTASTPQTLIFPSFMERPPFGPASTFQYPCIANSSGASAMVSVSYANIRE